MAPKQTDQSDRFKKAASDLDADQSDDALDRIMGKLDLKKKPDGGLTVITALTESSDDRRTKKGQT